MSVYSENHSDYSSLIQRDEQSSTVIRQISYSDDYEKSGDFFAAGGRFDEAVEFYSKAEKASKRRPEVLKKLAHAEMARGNIVAAGFAYEEALRVNSDDLSAQVGLVEVAIALNNHDEASQRIGRLRVALDQSGNPLAARLGSACHTMIQRMREQTALPAGSSTTDAPASGWDIRQAIGRLKEGEENGLRERAAMLIQIRAQSAMIESLKGLVAFLSERLRQAIRPHR
ncbi:tetratricopeptide repeat protein [Azospirillum sp. TSO35-2]|uniref:tetratricopeptide repeat protein n=1 Tax=Azospirillum sp. TSO35-2 TaxID=716796 RepID=UPI000D64908F|nr:tetratricopeptide repeat protein [Azospirillum sp. TSO35-2]